MIKFLDIQKINARHEEAFQGILSNHIKEGKYILGDAVLKFEEAYAKYCGTAYCIGVSNGLDALTLILKGYITLGKLKEGDKILVPANTFVASILSVIHAGLQPVLAEPNPKTYNLNSESLSTYLDHDIKAVIIVHLYGQISEIDKIQQFTKANNLLLIEDAAQAHGAIYNHKKAGSFGNASAFSFYPSKNLGALGDAGAITTSDKALKKVVTSLRNYGSTKKYENSEIGFNNRLDALQASFLLEKLRFLDADNKRRQNIAELYCNGINNPKIKIQNPSLDKSHVFHVFVLEVEDRKAFMTYLEQNNIQSLIHYPIPPHKQKALKTFKNVSLPITEQIHNTIVSLPISPVLTNNEVFKIIEVVNRY